MRFLVFLFLVAVYLFGLNGFAFQKKEDEALEITLAAGRTIVFPAIQFQLNHKIYADWSPIGYVVIQKNERHGELVSFILLDLNSGQEWIIEGVPLLSPDGKRFVYSICEPDANYNPPVFGIYRFEPNGITLEQEFPVTEGRCAGEAKWESESQIRFNEMVLDESQPDMIGRTPKILRFSPSHSQWIIENAP